MSIDLLDIRPFELCSIRPPTENASLSFRLAKNCYWNKCSFCPVYKYGAGFSKRSSADVFDDISRARIIDDFMYEQGIGAVVYHEGEAGRVEEIVEKVERARWEAGIIDLYHSEEISTEPDPRLRWFLPWFKEKPGLLECFHHILTWRVSGAASCFLGDADSLVLQPGFMIPAIRQIKMTFPSIRRITIYGRTVSAARQRSVGDMRELRLAGLSRVHFGLESGSDRVLSMMNKGITKADHIKGLLKTKEAGLSSSVYVMPGLGGKQFSDEHALETAEVITKTIPDFVRLRTLEIFPKTHLEYMKRNGTFIEAEEVQVIREIKAFIEGIDCPTEIMSDSATNLLQIQGRLPDERESILSEIDSYLDLSEREKLEFSLKARMASFYGQYGGITRDILERISPYVKSGTLDIKIVPDEDLRECITLIRGKLMP